MTYTYTLPSHNFQRPYDDAIHAILSDDPFDDWHGEAMYAAHDEPLLPPPMAGFDASKTCCGSAAT